jgi:cytochrome P450
MSDSPESTTPPEYTRDPPTHDGLPLIGNTHQLVREQGGLYEAAAEHGDIVNLRLLGLGNLYLVSSPELTEQILVDKDDQFQKASQSKDDLGTLIGQGLILSEGDLWERQRIEPAFYMDRIKQYTDTMAAEIQTAANDWEGTPTVDIESEMKALTLRILVKSIFGSEIDYEKREIRETVRTLQEPGQPAKQPISRMVPQWVPIPMWRRYKQGIDEMESSSSCLSRPAAERLMSTTTSCRCSSAEPTKTERRCPINSFGTN